jgi:hypothetical protein
MHALTINWPIPVVLDLPSGAARIFTSVSDACDFLEREWPGEHGEQYEHALLVTRSASMRLLSPEAAREAFIAACIEAKLLR